MRVDWEYGKVKGQFRWIKRPDQIAKEIINSDVQLFMANEAKSLMDPYVPAKNLMLAHNVSIYAEDDEGIVHYRSPYAHYQYKGVLYVSSITGSAFASSGEHKVPTSRKLEYSKFHHPLATSQWDKAMVTARGDDLTAAVQRFIKRGN